MKLPKTVNICGKICRVVQNPEDGGGSFSLSDYTIRIGTRYKQDIINSFFHEVIEGVLSERLMRYRSYPDIVNDGIIFCFTHKEFENCIADIVTALEGVLK